jgi:hypothetical protein
MRPIKHFLGYVDNRWLHCGLACFYFTIVANLSDAPQRRSHIRCKDDTLADVFDTLLHENCTRLGTVNDLFDGVDKSRPLLRRAAVWQCPQFEIAPYGFQGIVRKTNGDDARSLLGRQLRCADE